MNSNAASQLRRASLKWNCGNGSLLMECRKYFAADAITSMLNRLMQIEPAVSIFAPCVPEEQLKKKVQFTVVCYPI